MRAYYFFKKLLILCKLCGFLERRELKNARVISSVVVYSKMKWFKLYQEINRTFFYTNPYIFPLQFYALILG